MELEDGEPLTHKLHISSFSYIKEPFDLLRNFLVYFLWTKCYRKHF
jgi:hypothetical protein